MQTKSSPHTQSKRYSSMNIQSHYISIFLKSTSQYAEESAGAQLAKSSKRKKERRKEQSYHRHQETSLFTVQLSRPAVDIAGGQPGKEMEQLLFMLKEAHTNEGNSASRNDRVPSSENKLDGGPVPRKSSPRYHLDHRTAVIITRRTPIGAALSFSARLFPSRHINVMLTV